MRSGSHCAKKNISAPSRVLSKVRTSLTRPFPSSQKVRSSKEERWIGKKSVAAGGRQIKDMSLSGVGEIVMINETALLFKSSPPR